MLPPTSAIAAHFHLHNRFFFWEGGDSVWICFSLFLGLAGLLIYLHVFIVFMGFIVSYYYKNSTLL